MMGSIRTLHSVCRHCGTKLIPGESHCWEDGPICGDCAGIHLFGRDGWAEYRSTQDEIARLVNLIERWDREDVRDLQTWLAELDALLDDIDLGESHHDYVDLPGPEVPEDLRLVVTAIDRHGRCLLADGRILSSLDEYEPDEAEVSRLVGLIEQWDHEDVRDLQDWLLSLQGILSPSGNCVREYVSISGLPPNDVPQVKLEV